MFKISRRTAVAAATCLLASAVAASAGAAELTGTLKKVQESGSITLGYRESSVPFSYLNSDGKPVGYAFTVCRRVADAVQKELGLTKLDIKYQAVTSANRIPLIQNGTVDIECGSTTNSLQRQKEAAFSTSYFGIQVTAAVWKSAGIKKLADAFVIDDVLLAGQISNLPNPEDFEIVDAALSVEPYGAMFRKDDPQFKAVVDKTVTDMITSGELSKLYTQWFESPIPPKSSNLNFKMNSYTKELFANPSDKGI